MNVTVLMTKYRTDNRILLLCEHGLNLLHPYAIGAKTEMKDSLPYICDVP